MIGDWLASHGAWWLVLVLGPLLMLGGPVALVLLFARLMTKAPSRARDGIVFGVAVAGWASLSELLVPYCGLYASLPGIAVVTMLGIERGFQSELVLHGVNFIFWPALGWAIFQMRRLFRRERHPDSP